MLWLLSALKCPLSGNFRLINVAFQWQQDICMHVAIFLRKREGALVLLHYTADDSHPDAVLCSIFFGRC